MRGWHKKQSPVSLGNALGQLLERLGIAHRVREYEAVTAWGTIVGDRIANVSRAVRIRRGVLVVEVSSAPWRQELLMRKEEIIAKINGQLGSTVVTDIQFV